MFDLAFFKENEITVLLEDENVYKPDFLEEGLPKLLSAKAALRVGVTYCSISEGRKSIVSETADAIKQSKSEGSFLLVLGYVPNTKTENTYIRFDGYFFDSQGKELWHDIDNYDRKVSLR